VADGIETPEQLKALQTTACDMAQGFLFARPMGVAELHPLVMQVAALTLAAPPMTTNRLR
jgi:EAL domain-containing protein (putative c-di-GMP-specific phosphodiesterase class I)